jgi:hypothetical protein
MANMIIGKLTRSLAFASAILSMIALTVTPNSAKAGIGKGGAVALGLGAFALGSVLASPYYYGYPYYGYYGSPYYYPPGYGYPPAAYYPPSPYYGYPNYSGYPYYRPY